MNKKIFMGTLAVLMVMMILTGCTPKSPAPTPGSGAATAASLPFEGVELVVATWGWSAGNIRALSKTFEETYGCKILIDETAGNGDRINKIRAQQNNPEIDVALISQGPVTSANADGLFEKIDTSVVTNLNNLYNFARNKDGYGPCYSMVRYGILYDAAQIAEKDAPKSYADLFNGKYNGKISLPDITTTAGAPLLMALAGDEKNLDKGFKILTANKKNIKQFYFTSADVETAFATKEIAVTVFMDMNVKSMRDKGLSIKWVEPDEGTIAAAATINVVKNCKNPKLAQLYVNYFLSDDVQNRIAEMTTEAPTNKNATMPENMKEYLAFGEEAISKARDFDWIYIDQNRAAWIDRFQREVTN